MIIRPFEVFWLITRSQCQKQFSDWMFQVMRLLSANQSALFQHSD